jgi:hypothetical protein
MWHPENILSLVSLQNRNPTVFFVPDFSVVRFRSDFMLASEEHPMEVHTNQRL